MTHVEPWRAAYAIVHRFLECVSDTADRLDEAAELLAPGAVFVEHPNAVSPRGGMRDRDAIIASMREGRRMLARQEYDIRAHHVVDGWVVVRATWTGVLAIPAGGLPEWTELRAHIAQFYLLEAGRITRIESFDCYDPLGAPAF